MTIRFEESDFELLPLLFSRAAWQLDVGAPLPSALIVEAPSSPRPTGPIGETEELWDDAWHRRLSHIGDLDDAVIGAGLDDRLVAWNAMQKSLPAPWRDRFPPALDETFADWNDDVRFEVRPRVRHTVEPALVDAWHGGLHTFTVLPLVEPYARRLTRSRALVSHGAWVDTDFMVDTLRRWAADGG